jgi:hypothetical protein
MKLTVEEPKSGACCDQEEQQSSSTLRAFFTPMDVDFPDVNEYEALDRHSSDQSASDLPDISSTTNAVECTPVPQQSSSLLSPLVSSLLFILFKYAH